MEFRECIVVCDAEKEAAQAVASMTRWARFKYWYTQTSTRTSVHYFIGCAAGYVVAKVQHPSVADTLWAQAPYFVALLLAVLVHVTIVRLFKDGLRTVAFREAFRARLEEHFKEYAADVPSTNSVAVWCVTDTGERVAVVKGVGRLNCPEGEA